ncbi:MAG: TonB family protein [Myxococcota bacterium]
MTRLRTLAIPASLSTGGHALLVVALLQGGTAEGAAPVTPPTEMRFIEVTPPEPEPEPEQAPPPDAPPEPAPAPARRRVRTPPPPQAETPPPNEAAPPEPIAFDNVVVAPGAGGFAVPVGEGVERSGRVRAVRRVERTAPPAPASGRGRGLVAVADLSEPPAPPSLQARLSANYPASARNQGLTGRATVRLRVNADGSTRVLRVLSASTPAFGDACRQTLRGQRWRPGRDQGGNAVSTVIRFNCTFTVQP